jgi:hypothetical protein
VNLAVENLLLPTEEDVKVDISMIELLMEADSDSLVAYLSAISFFINEEIGLSPDMESLIIGKETFSFKEVDDITDIIKIQNCVITKVDDFNPLNENVKKLREKMLARQRRLKELKGDDDEGKSLSFLDLISILCSNANGINITNVFDLNFFQFNDQFNRMKLLDDYNVNVQALLHGADPKKTKLIHWMSKGE